MNKAIFTLRTLVSDKLRENLIFTLGQDLMKMHFLTWTYREGWRYWGFTL